jgi:hypothetical protein
VLVFCLGGASQFSFAQKTEITGLILDDIGFPMPSVNVSFQGTSIGTITDIDGRYELVTNKPSDSLQASFIGFQIVSKAVQKGEVQTINFELQPELTVLQDVVITGSRKDKNPAVTVMKKVVDAKSENDIYAQDYVQYEVYAKVELDLNNLDEEFQDRKVMQRFGFMFETQNEGDSNTKPYVPVILAENLSEYYYRKFPREQKEVIQASRISGVKNESVHEQLANTYLKINLYDDFVDIFSKGFVSPLASTGGLFYKYYIIDSLEIKGDLCYQLKVVPRREEDLAFKGDIWIAKQSKALVKADLSISENTNINWVNGLDVEQEFEMQDGRYVLVKEFTLLDFSISEKNDKTGLYARKNASYNKILINEEKPNSFYKEEVAVAAEALEKPDEYWEDVRHDTLSANEEQIYDNVQKLQKIPFFMSMKEVMTTVLTGYQDIGFLEVGPYLKLITHNPVEGVRLRLGVRTNSRFSEKIRIGGHLTYGFMDQRWKYGGTFLYLPNKDLRQSMGINYKYDIEQIGQSESAYPVDHILGSIIRRRPLDKLSMVQEIEAFYEKEWKRGISNTLSIINRNVYANQFDDFSAFGGYFNSTEVRILTRIAPGEKYVIGDFDRISLGSTKPVMRFSYGYGIKAPNIGDYEYHRLSFDWKHRIGMRGLGYSKYYVSAGKIFGNLPYPMLTVLAGNENYTYDHLSYNLMNYYEFVVDQYVSLYYTHYFNGLFLNKIPLVKKLEFRELVWGKGVWGSIRPDHQKIHPFPTFLTGLNQPYYEAGFGLENIFKVLRFDAFWRLSHLDNPGISTFALRGSMQIKF